MSDSVQEEVATPPSRSCGLWGAALACVFALGVLCTARAAGAARAGHDLPVAGWLERARIFPGDLVLEAKLDTGARTSSLHAENLQRFERAGRHWVAFDVTGDDGRTVRLERRLVRIASVRSALGVDEARLSVTLGICVGPVYHETEVTLVDRSGLAKPLLIGRRFLGGRLLVEPRQRYRLEPQCPRRPLS